ncbi:SDR family NAD(P)-dependent oxidoreductase [Gordonia phosphorivorans]|uniref:SDR family NAD(P)-dependent oxidoreductase n=1 Tax=Gordonia phosphorivorans TaxID=1056982 RepID=A0ABV6HC54_9ACTN
MHVWDTLLDRSVIAGYSRLGYALRAAGRSDDDPRPGALAGRTVAVTGATSGIGAAIAEGVAALGAHVIVVGRDGERAQRVAAGLVERFPDARVSVELGDVSDAEQVRDLAARLDRRDVDALVHNAGVMPPERTDSADGHELSLATHVLGPIALTELLLPALRRSPDARVVFMSSGGMYTAPLPVDDLDYRDGQYRGARAYARSKRIQTALVPLLADRWAAAGVMVAGMHPGWVDTPGVSGSLPRFATLAGPLLRGPAEGADTAVWLLGTEPAPPTGGFWHDRRRRPEHYLRRTRFSEAERRAVGERIARIVDDEYR